MSRLAATLRPGAGRIGVTGAAALGVLAFAAAFYAATLVPAQRHLHALRAQAAELGKRAATPDTQRRMPAADPDAFYDLFPSPSALPELLGRIYGAAEDQALKLEQGDYRVVRDTQGRLIQYQITFPVSGTYPQLRKFVAAALAAVPTLTLDSVKFERRNIGDAVSEARLKFVVFLGKTS